MAALLVPIANGLAPSTPQSRSELSDRKRVASAKGIHADGRTTGLATVVQRWYDRNGGMA